MKFKKPSVSTATLHRMRRSIRTRYAFATGFFLLVILAAFYIGGRIVLVHLVKDAERHVREIGTDINRIALRNADAIRHHVNTIRPEDRVRPLEHFLGIHGQSSISFALRLTAEGRFDEGRLLGEAEPERLNESDLAGYANPLSRWAAAFSRHNAASVPLNGPISAGIVHVRGRSAYCAIAPCPDGRFLLLGTPFSSSSFTSQVNETFASMGMRVMNRKIPICAVPLTARDTTRKDISTTRQSPYGLMPLVTEALDFYSGGFWKLGENPFEAVYTIRDIAGNPVSMIAVSLPKTFSSAAGAAIGRLTFFVAMIGIVLVLPIFWFQGHMLLNPLSLMTDCVRKARARCGEADCPRLDWKGDDEFAELAFSVNSLLETITNRTLAISEVENRQKALINGLPDGLMVFDRNHTLISVIKQPDGIPAIPGFAENSPIDVTVFGRDGVDAFAKAVDAAFATERTQMLTLEGGERPHTRWFDVRLSLTDKFFVLAIVRDITETVLDRNQRRAAEARLQHVHKQESLTLLAGSIAHDVNNILATILNTVEITFMGDSDPEHLATLSTVRDAVHRGSVMSKELMTFAGELKIVLQRANPAQLVHDARHLAEGVIGGNVQVHYDLPEDLPAVDADPDQVWKVFFNLIKNASESMDGVGEILVSARRYDMSDDIAVFFYSPTPLHAGPGVLITIKDNGPGIPQDMLRRIFDPYVSTKSSGRGFGLATVYTIVSAHHGGIRVESRLGTGTTFGIFLPASRMAVVRALPPRADAPAPAVPSQRNRAVLLVDDDPAILKTTGILLKALHYTVHAAATAADAQEIARRNATTLSCVLLDAHLTASDPVRLLAMLRITAPQLPVIVSSGSSIETVQQIFASQPYDAFLAKPYSLAELQAALNAV